MFPVAEAIGFGFYESGKMNFLPHWNEVPCPYYIAHEVYYDCIIILNSVASHKIIKSRLHVLYSRKM